MCPINETVANMFQNGLEKLPNGSMEKHLSESFGLIDQLKILRSHDIPEWWVM